MIKHSLSFRAAALLVCAALAASPAAAGQAVAGNAGDTLNAHAPTPGGSHGAVPGETRSESRVGALNGYAWMNSDNASKLSFLLGVESGIAMEMALDQEQAKFTGAPAELSPFQRGWTAAFDNTPRQAIVDRIDAFYTAHPSEKKRHLFDVIWEQMLVPALPVHSARPGDSARSVHSVLPVRR